MGEHGLVQRNPSTYHPVISKTRHCNTLNCDKGNLAFENRLQITVLCYGIHDNMNGFSRLFRVRKKNKSEVNGLTYDNEKAGGGFTGSPEFRD